MKRVTIASNMFNERDQIQSWLQNMLQIADGGIVIVDNGSTDGTLEYLKEFGAAFIVTENIDKEKFGYLAGPGPRNNIVVVLDNIILREGYGPARNHLRDCAKIYFNSHWCCYFDADERISEKDFHAFRFLKDNLIDEYDVLAFPRINWNNTEMTSAKTDVFLAPDFQARMTRLNSPLKYVRKLHEQIKGCNKIHTEITSPKINHFHRATDSKKRDYIGKVCAKLHQEDNEYGDTYPLHHKEQHYRDLLEKEGL